MHNSAGNAIGVDQQALWGGCAPASRIASVAALLVALSACGSSPDLSVEQAVARITADGLRTHVSVLAHDSMRGRDTGDIGYERARDYVAREFERIGLEPIDGDSYMQPFDLLEVVSDRGSRLRVGADAFEFPDVIVAPDWTGETPMLSAEGVYVGNGLVTGEVGAQNAAVLDGKIAFVLAGAPDGRADEPEIAMRERAEVELAHRAGAVAVVVLNPDASERAWTARANPRRPTRALLDGSTPSPRAAVSVGPSASKRLIDLWGVRDVLGADGVDVGVVTVEPRHEIREVRSWNVAGMWPGVDPSTSGEAVVFTAHLDHVGVGPPDENGDSIYNGTHDNALGVAKVLGVAEAVMGARLRRSIVFLATGAEESGLLGAWHYVNNPVVPLERTVAAINHDGGLVGGRTDDVFAWGPEFSTIEEDVARAATETGMVLSADKSDPFGPSAGLLYRSDHYPFLISGVPVVYLMPGFSVDGDRERGRRAWQDYLATIHHVQADNFDDGAPYESPVALTSLSVRLAWRLASADGMPQTHDDAPITRTRGKPTGFFFGESM